MLVRLLYASRAAAPGDQDALGQILKQSKHYNPSVGVTGVLCCSGGIFMQALEGSRAAVNTLYAKILRDPRHHDVELLVYEEIVERRFANPKIGDTVRRLCFDGSNRQPKFIMPSIADNLAQGRGVEGLALESALWCRYCAGTSESGKGIEPNDPIWDRLTARATAARTDPGAWLSMRDIYGAAGEAPAFREAFARWLGVIWSEGTEAALRRYVG